jgi:Kelch motif
LGYEAYQYGPERTTWSRGFIQSDLPENITRYVSNGAAVSVPSENLGFYFGGLRGDDWGPTTQSTRDWYPANTLIEADMSTMRSTQWSNNTLPDNITARASAELVWIPVGGQGALVAIGGVTAVESLLPAGLNDSQISDIEDEAPGFMTSLPVYDVVSKTWYTQNTTGDAPGRLTEFCSVVAPARDSSSFNVYIYGGYDGLNSTSIPSDDVWILSIPSFTWIKAYSGVSAHGRRGHTCQRIYPDQMLVIGGVNPTPQRCIEGGPIQVFNLNTLKFQNLYDPREWSEYDVPDIVTAVIGGNGQGGSRKSTNFSDNALGSLFETPYTKATETYYPYSSATGSPGESATPPPTASSGGLAKWVAPVLGVVLGLIVLSIIIVLILLYRRRKSLRRKSMTSSNAGGSSNNRIMNWVNRTQNHSLEPKTDPSVTSTEGDNETSVSSPLVGALEVGGQQRYEIEGMEREKPPMEMPTPFNFQNHPNYPHKIDFAYGPGTSTSSSGGRGGGGGAASSKPSDYSQPTNGSQTQIHGLGLSSPSSAISPQSPQSTTLHSHSESGGSATSTSRNAPSPYALHPHSPEDVGNLPSPTSSGAQSPDLGSPVHNNANRAGTGDAAAAGLERRPTHHRNVSSMSSNMYQLPSPDIVFTPEEDLRRSQLLASGIEQQRQQQKQGEGAATGTGAAGGAEQRLGALEGLERKKTAGKKSSFGEMLDEEDEKVSAGRGK